MKYLILLALLLGGCARSNRAVIYRHGNWDKLSEKRPIITIEIDRPGEVFYKDKDFEVKLDGKKPGLLEGAIKTIKVDQ